LAAARELVARGATDARELERCLGEAESPA
jgi:hypothetical protein